MIQAFLHKARNILGILLKDFRRYRRALSSANADYLKICNRNETLEASIDGLGYRCQWQWTSDLHAPKYFPDLGLRLMKKALEDHPVRFKSIPERFDSKPDISFIIGHRGLDRLPHLLSTLESIAGQADVTVECLVVEQDSATRIADKLPAWVRHVLTPPPTPDMPYCRSWTFNIGAKLALADVLVLHDNDMPVPEDYSSTILKKVLENYEVINLKRFIFYLSQRHTNEFFLDKSCMLDHAPESIMQNSEGGGSIAITRNAYVEIGGFDESFIGWGGEDNEFWDRAKTRRLWPYAFLPIIHLWHGAQPGKEKTDNITLALYQKLSEISPEMRIAKLRTLDSGNLSGPVGYPVDA